MSGSAKIPRDLAIHFSQGHAQLAAESMGRAVRVLRDAGLPADEAERIRQKWCELFARARCEA